MDSRTIDALKIKPGAREYMTAAARAIEDAYKAGRAPARAAGELRSDLFAAFAALPAGYDPAAAGAAAAVSALGARGWV